MPSFPSYSDLVKKIDPKSDVGKKAVKIAKELENSRQAVTKNVADKLPEHVKTLNSSLKELKTLSKDKKADKGDLEKVEDLISQLETDIGMLSQKPDFEATVA